MHDKMSHPMDKSMQQCIDECHNCHSVCLHEAMNHCLETGGKHVEPSHFRLMLSCAEICETSANFMLMSSEQHREVCGVCAQVCEACAQSCEQVGEMQETVDACRRCAESCRQMAGQSTQGTQGMRMSSSSQTPSQARK